MAPSGPHHVPHHNGRVLLVDVDRGARMAARDALVAGGYDVVEVDDGARALALLRQGFVLLPPSSSAPAGAGPAQGPHGGNTTLRPAVAGASDIDVIILDWALPGLSGGELLARLRGDGDERPVIVTAEHASAEDTATMLSLGADDVILKPVNQRMLLARVTAQLRRRRAPSLTPGEVLDGRYRLQQSLGEGRVGVVWRARHVELDVTVDVAVVGSRGSEALRHEARRTAGISHPGFLRMRDIVRLDTTRHLAVADALPSTTVKRLVDQGAITPDRAFAITTSVLDVLVALHQAGVAHKNISANSVFVDDSDGQDRVVVVDGATLRLISTSRKRVGISAYMPPEATAAGAGKDADVYAVGRLLCHLLTGKPETLPEHPVARALDVALARTPGERCSARALLRAVAIAGKSRRKATRTRP
jgi:DNA-binding response OmpR family regulator